MSFGFHNTQCFEIGLLNLIVQQKWSLSEGSLPKNKYFIESPEQYIGEGGGTKTLALKNSSGDEPSEFLPGVENFCFVGGVDGEHNDGQETISTISVGLDRSIGSSKGTWLPQSLCMSLGVC